MTHSPSLSADLELKRREYMERRKLRIKKLQVELAFASLCNVAARALDAYPSIRYIKVRRPKNIAGTKLVVIEDVLDASRNDISRLNGENVCAKIEWLFFEASPDAEEYEFVEPGEYDLLELANRKF